MQLPHDVIEHVNVPYSAKRVQQLPDPYDEIVRIEKPYPVSWSSVRGHRESLDKGDAAYMSLTYAFEDYENEEWHHLTITGASTLYSLTS